MTSLDVVYVDDYAVGDGTTDDSGNIQDAIDSLTEGGILVFSPGKTYAIASGVTIGNGSSSQFSTTNNNLTICAGGSVHEVKGMSWGTPGFPSVTGCRIKWTGSTGTGTMFEILGPIFGINVIGNLFLDGDGKANKCFRAVSHSNCKFDSITAVNWLTHGLDLDTVAATSISGQANGLTAASNFYNYIASCSPSADGGKALSLDGYKAASGQDVTHNHFGLVKTIVSKNEGKGIYLGYTDYNFFNMFIPQIFDDGGVTSPTSGCADVFFAGTATPFVAPDANFFENMVLSAAGLKYSGTPGHTHFRMMTLDAGASVPSGGILDHITVDHIFDSINPGVNHNLSLYPSAKPFRTNGLTYVAAASGAPTVTPHVLSNMVPLKFNTANNSLYAYNGAWIQLGAGGGGDTTAPTLTSSTPVDNATGVSVSANIVLNFSENVQAGTGNITLQDLTSAVDNRTISISGNQVTFSGSTLTINPSADLGENRQYQVIVSAGVINDAASNTYSGLTAGQLNFTTVASAGGGSWTNVYSANPTTALGVDLNGYNLRQVIPGSVFSSNYSQVRFTLKPLAGAGAVLSDVFYGRSDTGGDNHDFAATPVRITFSSANNVTLTAGGGGTLSNEKSFVGSAARDMVLSVAFSNTSDVGYAIKSGASLKYKTAAAANVSELDVGAYTTESNAMALISKVEVL